MVPTTSVVVSPHGDLDIASAPEVRALLQAAIDQVDDGGSAICDLAEVEFCDSHGVAVLLGAIDYAAERGRRLAVRGATRSVRRVFDITGVAQALGVHDET